MIQKNLLALFFNNITNYFYTEKLALSIRKKSHFQLLITNHYDKKKCRCKCMYSRQTFAPRKNLGIGYIPEPTPRPNTNDFSKKNSFVSSCFKFKF